MPGGTAGVNLVTPAWRLALRPMREDAAAMKTGDALKALLREHGSGPRLGLAVGVGVVVGCSPFLGLHTLIALALATLFRLNRLAVILGTQVSVPPLTPMLLLLNAQIGARVLQGHWLTLSMEQVRSTPARTLVAELFWNFLVGGLVVGGVLAAVLGWTTATLVQRQKARS